MRSFRAVMAVMLVLILLLGVSILGAMSRMVQAGRLEPKLLGRGIAVFLIMLLLALAVVVIRCIRSYKDQLKRPGSADILEEIIKLGHEEKDNNNEE